jgi:hypothetical protein
LQIPLKKETGDEREGDFMDNFNTRTKAGMKVFKRIHYQVQAGMIFFEKYPIPASSCYVPK